MRSLRMRAVITAAAIVAVMAGSMAWASVPDADGTIHACYATADSSQQGGAVLRVIDADEGGTCRGASTEVTFNQQGVRGPGVVDAQAETLDPGSDATANLVPITSDPEGDFRLKLGIPEGEAGTGAMGLTGYTVVQAVGEQGTDESPLSQVFATAFCPDGTRVINGSAALAGGAIQDGHWTIALTLNQPTFDGSGWQGAGIELGPDTAFQVVVRAICVAVES